MRGKGGGWKRRWIVKEKKKLTLNYHDCPGSISRQAMELSSVGLCDLFAGERCPPFVQQTPDK